MRSTTKAILATALTGIATAPFTVLAANMPVKAPPLVPATPAAAINDWSGFYIGGHAGYLFAESKVDTSLLPSPAAFDGRNFGQRIRGNSWMAGGQVGYNWQSNGLVFGGEADFSY